MKKVLALALAVLMLATLLTACGGGNKLSGVGKALGQSIRDFKKEIKADDDKPEAKEETKAE